MKVTVAVVCLMAMAEHYANVMNRYIFVSGSHSKEADEIIINFGQQCKKTEKGVTEQDLKILLIHGIPIARGGKCLLACVMEKSGLVDENGDIKKPTYENELASKCAKIKNSDRCEQAYEYQICIQNGQRRKIAKKLLGLPSDNLEPLS